MKDTTFRAGFKTFPRFLFDLLNAPPRHGEGVHQWIFKVARNLHAHVPAGEIVALLESRLGHCGRHVPRSEILAAVQNSIGCAWTKKGSAEPFIHTPSKWPTVNREQRAAIIRDNDGLAALWEISPVRIEDNAQHTEEIVDHLFPGNPLLCCGKSSSVFDTKPRDDWRGELDKLSFIVPSPMTDVQGVTKDGRPSKHTLSNTGPRRFLVIEQDQRSEDEQAAILLHLGAHAPLALAVHSGRTSLHGWFYCAGQPEDRLERFLCYSVGLGADPATWTRSQFVRMPDGTRDNGKRQTVFFFNPAVIK